jgi:hypothetical protein
MDTYVPGIDPSLAIAPKNIVTRTLILSEEQKQDVYLRKYLL